MKQQLHLLERYSGSSVAFDVQMISPLKLNGCSSCLVPARERQLLKINLLSNSTIVKGNSREKTAGMIRPFDRHAST